mgnify:CR=1 FL=1
MKQKKIILVDGNNFFASCEQLVNPDLTGKPICVLSNNDGCVIARSQEAKQIGVPMGIPYFMAKKSFPQVIYLSSDFALYHDISERMMRILKNYSDLIDVYSIDEAFLDISGTNIVFKLSYIEIAKKIKKDIENHIGINVSVGLAPSVVLAKTANYKAKKLSGIYEINKNSLYNELQQIPVEEIWGVGKNISKTLRKYGIFYANQIILEDDKFIKFVLGKKGLELKYELSGFSIIPITGIEQKPKSIQRTRAFPEFSSNKEYIKTEIMMHLHNVCKKLRHYELEAGYISVMLRTKDFKVIYAGENLQKMSNNEIELTKIIKNLFNKIFNSGITYRSSGVWASNLNDTKKIQLSLFYEKQNSKESKISSVLDKLEDKFGKGILSVGQIGIKDIAKYHSQKAPQRPF